MLLSLSIRNYATIDKLNIDFTKGLNVLTGETGAGKSIIVGALSLALGYRANTDAIRSGNDKMAVQALFSLDHVNGNLKAVLEEYSIEYEDGNILLSREIFENGKNVSRVNDVIVNVNTLKNISMFIVDIHGQHEHQKLLNPETHIDFLDDYANDMIREQKELTEKTYYAMKKSEKDYHQQLENVKNAKEKEEEYISKVKEITSLELKIGEDELLENRKNILANSEKLFEYVDAAYQLLYGGEKNVNDKLNEAALKFESAANIDVALMKDYESLNEALIVVQETIFNLREYKDSIEFSPHELDEIQSRLNKINSLKRKYGENIEDILNESDHYQQLLNSIQNSTEETAEALERYNKNKQDYLRYSVELSELRKKAAERLTKRLMANLNELAMPNAVFEVRFEDKAKFNRFSPNGIDEIQFFISTNTGQELKPLSKIVSGGEISRIMLAIKSIMADLDHTDTLIFDEIDTGISGRTAQIVAEKMSQLSRAHQILCITHLSQIASMADTHFLIEKYVQNDNTYTSFCRLDFEQRKHELARMLGGVHVTSTTLEHASEMLRLAVEYKK